MKKNVSPSQSLTPDQKKILDLCLVESNDGRWFLFRDAAAGGAGIMNPRAIYANWEAFSHKADTAEGVAELEHLHQICFEEPVPKDLVKDPIELSIRVFVQLAATALDRLDSGSKTPGPRGMAKKLENRMYECLSFEVPHNIKMPPQAKECLKFLAELAALDEYKINESRAIVTIPEKVVREKVMRDQLRLHTRQDPWRIFQYYRPVLIKEKLIRLV